MYKIPLRVQSEIKLAGLVKCTLFDSVRWQQFDVIQHLKLNKFNLKNILYHCSCDNIAQTMIRHPVKRHEREVAPLEPYIQLEEVCLTGGGGEIKNCTAFLTHEMIK